MRLCFVLALSAIAGKAAVADEFTLTDGTTMSGTIIQGHTLSLMVRSDLGGVKPVMINNIDRVRMDLADGQQVEGKLLSWRDGVCVIDAGDRLVSVENGNITLVEENAAAPEIRPTASPQAPLVIPYQAPPPEPVAPSAPSGPVM